jgi:hypothetical protein
MGSMAPSWWLLRRELPRRDRDVSTYIMIHHLVAHLQPEDSSILYTNCDPEKDPTNHDIVLLASRPVRHGISPLFP